MTRIFGLVLIPDRPCAHDPDLFYAKGPLRIERAKAICRPCPHRERCLATALELGEVHGVWGGLSAPERQELTLRPRGPHPKEAAA